MSDHAQPTSTASDSFAHASSGVVDPSMARPSLPRGAVRDILVYGALRLGLFLLLTFVIHSVVILLSMADFFPLLMSALLALILALPLSMFLFRKLRVRVASQIAHWDAERRAHKEQLRAQLEERMGS